MFVSSELSLADAGRTFSPQTSSGASSSGCPVLAAGGRSAASQNLRCSGGGPRDRQQITCCLIYTDTVCRHADVMILVTVIMKKILNWFHAAHSL